MTGKTDEIVSYVQQQTDRLSQAIDGKRGTLVEAHRRQDQPAHDRDRPRHLRRAEVDRDPRPGLLAVDHGQRQRRRPHHHLGRRARHRRAQPLAEGAGAGVARGDRAVAPGLDRGRHRDAGDLEDPAHRHGRAVRAPARRQHPAAGSADRRPRQPQLAGARAGHPRRRLRLGHERRHLAQWCGDPDAGRPARHLQRQDLEGAGGSGLALDPVRRPRPQRWSRPPPWSSRPTARPLPRSPSARPRWNRWSPPSTCAPPTSISACRASPSLLDESLAAAEERARDIARVVAETAGAGSAAISRQFEAVRAASEEEHRQTVEAMHDIYRQTTAKRMRCSSNPPSKFADWWRA